MPESKVLAEVGLEKRGPYAGRKGAPFKGKMWERKKEERTAELARLLQGADTRIAAWKKVRFLLRPAAVVCRRLTFSLPFPPLSRSFVVPAPLSTLHQAQETEKAKAKPSLPF